MTYVFKSGAKVRLEGDSVVTQFCFVVTSFVYLDLTNKKLRKLFI